MIRMIDLGDWCPRCMVCARLMHKKNTSKDCDRRDSNVDNNNYNNNYNNNNNNNNNNKWCEFRSVQSTKWLFLSAVSRSNWNLECWFFVEWRKPEDPVKNSSSKDKNQKQLPPTCETRSGNWSQTTAMGGARSHHCTIPVDWYLHRRTR